MALSGVVANAQPDLFASFGDRSSAGWAIRFLLSSETAAPRVAIACRASSTAKLFFRPAPALVSDLRRTISGSCSLVTGFAKIVSYSSCREGDLASQVVFASVVNEGSSFPTFVSGTFGWSCDNESSLRTLILGRPEPSPARTDRFSFPAAAVTVAAFDADRNTSCSDRTSSFLRTRASCLGAKLAGGWRSGV